MFVVTGATGHIGSVVVRELIREGHPVRAVLPPFENPELLSGLPVETAVGDVTCFDDCLSFIKPGDIILHLAGLVAITGGGRERLRQVNVEGTRNVARAALVRGAARMVYVSSVHAFPELPGTVDEDIPIVTEKAFGAYGQSKAEATLAVRQAITEGLNAVIVHPSGVIGPYDLRLSNNMTHMFIRYLTGKLRALVTGAYDFVDVRDVAQGIIEAAVRGRAGEHYILSGQWITIPRLIDHLRPLIRKPLPRLSLPLWLAVLAAPFAENWSRISHKQPLFTRYSMHTLRASTYFSHEKATRELDYHPRSLNETLRDTVEWLKGSQAVPRDA